MVCLQEGGANAFPEAAESIVEFGLLCSLSLEDAASAGLAIISGATGASEAGFSDDAFDRISMEAILSSAVFIAFVGSSATSERTFLYKACNHQQYHQDSKKACLKTAEKHAA